MSANDMGSAILDYIADHSRAVETRTIGRDYGARTTRAQANIVGSRGTSIMDTSREREHLAQADRHIAELKGHIARQRNCGERTVSSPAHGGRDRNANGLEDSLLILRRHRKMILDSLD